MIGEKGVCTHQASQLHTLSKFDCFLLFQMDKQALTEGQFDLPQVLHPTEGSFFPEVCIVFLVNENLIKEVCQSQDGKENQK